MNRVEWRLPKMSCGGCRANIEEALLDLPGVQAEAFDLSERRVTLAYDPDRISPTALAEALSAAGYPPEI